MSNIDRSYGHQRLRFVPQGTEAPSDRRDLVYLIESDPYLQRTIAFCLETANYVPRAFASGQAFLAELDQLAPGCVLLNMPRDELDVIERLGTRIERHPVIVMAEPGGIRAAVAAMQLGAFDVIEKPFKAKPLYRALERAFAQLRSRWEIIEQKHQAQARIASLSPRELETLRALFAGLANKQIAARFALSVRTVEMHRASMMSKLRAKRLPDAIRMAAFVGLDPLTPDEGRKPEIA